jgi:hypothetical protein
MRMRHIETTPAIAATTAALIPINIVSLFNMCPLLKAVLFRTCPNAGMVGDLGGARLSALRFAVPNCTGVA